MKATLFHQHGDSQVLRYEDFPLEFSQRREGFLVYSTPVAYAPSALFFRRMIGYFKQ